ncbi:uncharacterized LOC118071289 [Chelonus insularis]|uniref:uncharacterized LOC118071289 n=1 Tax=Chelonus insularis TaxID=460826 RepID=UPI00158F27DB|nr:uncharacterized LOC118071289 [Chelonus insularis]KAG8148332.1 HzNVorf9-1-like protein [Chelonus insularis]
MNIISLDTSLDPNDCYQNIIHLSGTNEGVLEKIYNTDKSIFTTQNIDKIICLCNKTEFGIHDLLELGQIAKLTVFTQYIEENNIDRLSILEKCLDSFILAICKYKNQNFYMIRNKLLPLLRMRAKPPYGEPDILIRGKISIKYPDLINNQRINNNVDIAHMIRAQQINIRNSPCQRFIYNERNDLNNLKPVVLTGPTFTTVVTAMINLQNIMLKNDNEMGIDVKPFLEINSFNWNDNYLKTT